MNHYAKGKWENESTQKAKKSGPVSKRGGGKGRVTKKKLLLLKRLPLPYVNGCQIKKEIKVDSLGYLESEKSNSINLNIRGNEERFKVHIFKSFMLSSSVLRITEFNVYNLSYFKR